MSSVPLGTAIPPTQRIGVFGVAKAFTISRYLGIGYADPPPYPFAVTRIARHLDSVSSINGLAVLPAGIRSRRSPIPLTS
ncbi:hypothetical protein ABIF74_008962 [Bradyrhizobium japonicum]